MPTSLCVQVAFSGVRPGAKHNPANKKHKMHKSQVHCSKTRFKSLKCIEISEWLSVSKKHHRITLPSPRCSAQYRDTVSKEAAGREQRELERNIDSCVNMYQQTEKQNVPSSSASWNYGLCFEPSASLARMLNHAFPPGSKGFNSWRSMSSCMGLCMRYYWLLNCHKFRIQKPGFRATPRRPPGATNMQGPWPVSDSAHAFSQWHASLRSFVGFPTHSENTCASAASGNSRIKAASSTEEWVDRALCISKFVICNSPAYSNTPNTTEALRLQTFANSANCIWILLQKFRQPCPSSGQIA